MSQIWNICLESNKKKCLQLQVFSQLKLNKSLASPPTLLCYLASWNNTDSLPVREIWKLGDDAYFEKFPKLSDYILLNLDSDS